MKVTNDEPLTEKATPMKKISIKLFARVSLIKLSLLATGMLLSALGTGLGQSTVQFSASSYAVPEWAGTVTLTVKRMNDTSTEISVDYATADGTATNGLKYIATNGTLAFAAGETNRIITVPILNDGLVGGTKDLPGNPEQPHQCRPGHAHERYGLHYR